MNMHPDLFNRKDNRKRVYALRSFTVRCRNGKWFYRKTDSDDPFKGPYSSEMSVCLMIARHLRKELLKRDSVQPPV